jgi:hypothetical protein
MATDKAEVGADGNQGGKADDEKGVPMYHDGRYIGFSVRDTVYLQKCGRCGRENWAPAVSTGSCAWCGWVPPREVE